MSPNKQALPSSSYPNKPIQSSTQVNSLNKSNQFHEFTSHDHDYLAYFFQTAACLIWTCSYIYNNENDLDIYETNLSRGIVGVFCNYIVMRIQGSTINFGKSRIFNGLLLINICILTYLFILPLSQVYLPLPIVHTIGCTSIATVYILDYFMNGVVITRNGLIGIMFAIGGAVIMANDRVILGMLVEDYHFQSDFKNYRQQSNFILVILSFVLLVSRIIHSYGIVSMKYYPEISVFELNFHACILAVITGGFGYLIQQKHRPFSIFWPSLITTGFGQFLCMSMFVYSLKLTKKTGNVMIINGLNIVFAFMISYFRYGQKINIILQIGSVCLFISMLIVVMESMKAKKLQFSGNSGNKQIISK